MDQDNHSARGNGESQFRDLLERHTSSDNMVTMYSQESQNKLHDDYDKQKTQQPRGPFLCPTTSSFSEIEI